MASKKQVCHRLNCAGSEVMEKPMLYTRAETTCRPTLIPPSDSSMTDGAWHCMNIIIVRHMNKNKSIVKLDHSVLFWVFWSYDNLKVQDSFQHVSWTGTSFSTSGWSHRSPECHGLPGSSKRSCSVMHPSPRRITWILVPVVEKAWNGNI